MIKEAEDRSGQSLSLTPNSGIRMDDVIEFGSDVFADFAAVLASASQVGSDTVISFDANNTVTLKNVNLSSFHQDDFRLIAA
jgi:hypothetical protein